MMLTKLFHFDFGKLFLQKNFKQILRYQEVEAEALRVEAEALRVEAETIQKLPFPHPCLQAKCNNSEIIKCCCTLCNCSS